MAKRLQPRNSKKPSIPIELPLKSLLTQEAEAALVTEHGSFAGDRIVEINLSNEAKKQVAKYKGEVVSSDAPRPPIIGKEFTLMDKVTAAVPRVILEHAIHFLIQKGPLTKNSKNGNIASISLSPGNLNHVLTTFERNLAPSDNESKRGLQAVSILKDGLEEK